MNPFLPLMEYIPDGEPHVFGDRVYLYGSHDKANSDRFCVQDYTVWSASVDDLSDWKCHGVTYRKDQDPRSKPGKLVDYYAPDCVQGNDGRYYLYYCAMGPNTKNFGPMSVAVSDNPAGPFEYLGDICYPDGTPVLKYLTNDPAVLNDNGRIWLYYGWGLARDFRSKLFAPMYNIVQSKDYINYILTGVHSCDYSDASGMLLLDVEHKCWSKEMLEICGVSESQMPKLFESYDCIGMVKPEIAAALGITSDVKVVAGAGDNAAAAVGTGVVGEGGCNISLGTSGTVFISSEKFGVDPNNALHAFAHADGGWHLMGCMLSAASCNKWLLEDIFGTSDHAAEQAPITEDKLGENHVFFLPYLMGERSPINDTNARGTFIGMTMDTTRADMVLSVLEGVAFAIRDSVEVARSLGITINTSKICGGGAKSPLWKRIFANVLNVELEVPISEQGPGMGGAMLAMVACGEYESVKDCCDKLCAVASTVKPESELVAKYEVRYQKFKKIYPAVKNLFPEIQ